MLYLNPLTPVIELFRWALLGYGTINVPALGLAVVVIFFFVLLGGMFFSKLQIDFSITCEHLSSSPFLEPR